MPDYQRRIETLHGPHGLLRRLSNDRLNGLLYDTAVEVAQWVEAEIIKRAPEDSGNLKGAIKAYVEVDGEGRFKIIAESDPGKAPYAPAVDLGSGIWGPSHAPIVAKTPAGMQFTWHHLGMLSVHGPPRALQTKDGRQLPSRMKVMAIQGQKGQKFFERGWRAAMGMARREFGEMLKKI